MNKLGKGRGKMVKKTDTPAKFILGPPVAY